MWRSTPVLVVALAVLAACTRAPASPGRQADVRDAWTSCAHEFSPTASGAFKPGKFAPTPTVAAPGPDATTPAVVAPTGEWPKFVGPSPGDPDPSAAALTQRLAMPRLPADFTPAEVIVCAIDSQPRADGSHDQVLSERRGSGVAALTKALRLPDVPRTTGACNAGPAGLVWFALLDGDGRWVFPGVPADACGMPRAEVRGALDGLRLSTVATTVLPERKRVADPARIGCEGQGSDLVSATAARAAAPTGTPDAPVGDVRLCVYNVWPAQQYSPKPIGYYGGGAVLPAATWTTLRPKLLASGAPAPCTAPAGRFALFRTPDVYLELDGCYRLFFDTPSGGALRQGSADLAAEIERAL